MIGEKVVSAHDMAEAEKKSIRDGAQDRQYMLNAAQGIADIITANRVFLLVGKGNNGGDAFAAGTILLKRGVSVHAFHIYPQNACSPLCQEMRNQFASNEGSITDVKDINQIKFGNEGVILDGLLGTGFQGAVEGLMKETILKANSSKLPKIAIDIPSGLDGNTGKANIAINADVTIYLGAPKTGFFLNQGYRFVGALKKVDFGLPQKYLDALSAMAHLIDEEKIGCYLPEIVRTRHKYEAGYVLGFGGSTEMTGALIMAGWATLRSGAGIVRLFHPPACEFGNVPLELIKEETALKTPKRFLEEAERARACFIGPGMGRKDKAILYAKKILQSVKIPCICDADSLYLFSRFSKLKTGAEIVLTPHRKEMLRLLEREKAFPDDKDFISACELYAKQQKKVLLLKGAPTFIFSDKTPTLIIPKGDPGMATAGTGDVLTGMIAAFIAQGLPPFEGTALAAFLHGLAGELAAKELTSYSMMATDLIQFLPNAFRLTLSA